MSYIRPATLTNTDIDAIRSIYGDNRDLMIQDLRTGNLPDGVNAEDLLAYVLEERSLNPDDASLAYLWEDDDVVEMLHDMRDKNATDAELAALIRDIEAYLTQAGESTDLMNDAARIINEYAEKYGMDPSTGSKMSEEIQNLVTFFRAVSPEMWFDVFRRFFNFNVFVDVNLDVLFESWDLIE